MHNTKQKETYRDVHINEKLTVEQRMRIMKLEEEYQHVFSDVPKLTHLTEHRIQLTSKEPIRERRISYRIIWLRLLIRKLMSC